MSSRKRQPARTRRPALHVQHLEDRTTPAISIASPAAVGEGNAGTSTVTFAVTLDAPVGNTVTVDYDTADGTATGADNDFVPASGTLTFLPGTTTPVTPLTVTINGDTKFEATETFSVVLSNAVNDAIGTGTATGTITNDDAAPTLSIGNVTLAEGNAGMTAFTFTVTRSGPTALPITVDFATADGTATAGSDYTAAGGTLVFTPLDTSKTITVLVNGDTLFENNQTFVVNLTNANKATIADGQGLGTINNDDALPTLAVADATASEAAGTIAFSITRTGASEVDTTVNVATADGTAVSTAGGPGTPDFTALTANAFVIPADLGASKTATFTVTLNNDAVYEAAEQFLVNLSIPIGATVADGQGVGTVTDDDTAPSLTVNDVSVSEGGGTAAFTVTLTGATALPVAVNYATAAGTAVSAAGGPGTPDYTATSGTLTFNPSVSGTQTLTITVPVVNDTTNEPTEQFAVNLSGPTNGATLADAQGVGTITDDDAVPSLAIADVTLAEGNAGTTAFTFTVSLSAASGQAVTVNYATADVTAVAGSDYTAAAGTLTFAPGQTSKTVTVLVAGEAVFEVDQTFVVNLSGATNATVGDGQGVGTITNDDAAPTLAVGDVSANEAAGTITFTVTRTGGTELPASVNYATADGTAKAAALGIPGTPDYTPAAGTLNFVPSPAATATQTFTVPLTDDAVNEADDTILANLSGATGATVADGQGVGTITNDDPVPTLSVSDAANTVLDQEVDGGTTAYTFTVTLSAASGQTVVVNYATVDGTATATGSSLPGTPDYQAAAGTLTFLPGETTKTVTVNVIGDTVFEPNQLFFLDLAAPAPTLATLANPRGVGTINNNDAPPTLTIAGPGSVAEGGTATFTVTRTGASEVPTSVDYSTVADTATDAAAGPGTPDYAAAVGTLTFSPFEFVKTFTVTVASDGVYEAAEQFFAKLANPVNGNIATAQAAATIPANGTPPSLAINDITVNEADGTAFFTVTLTGATALPVAVDFQTADGTAVAAGGGPGTPDYTPAAGTLTFGPSAAATQTLTVAVPLTNDAISEASETFTVTLSNASNGAAVADATGQATITDGDGLPALSIDDVTQAEGTGGPTAYTFTVTLSAVTAQTVTVSYATAPGTAAVGDYGAAAGSLTFAPGETTKTLTVLVAGDATFEDNETFAVNLSAPQNAALGDGQGVGTVNNDDTAPVLTINDVTANEAAGTVTFTVTLTGPTEVAATVNYATADDTAVATAGGPGEPDYTPASGTLTFAPATSTQTFTVAITDDAVYEAAEQFVANLSLPIGATIGDPQGAATITNTAADDPAPVLAVGDATANEAAGTITFTVTLTGATALPIAVNYATGDANAVAAGGGPGTPDYTPAAGTLTFGPSAAATQTLTITVPVTNDTTQESAEQFVVNLTGPTNGATIGDGQGVGTVTDDDPPPVAGVGDVMLAEGNAGTTAFTFAVTLSAASALPVTVADATADGTATAGSDYTAASGTVTFAPGETSKTVTVLVTGDTVFEPNQTFVLNLSSPTNATVGDGQGVGTINNDEPLPTLTVGDVTVTEGAATVTFTVTRTGPTEVATTVDYATADGSAVASAGGPGTPDYAATAGTLTFAPSLAASVSQTFTVPLTDDGVYEGVEQFVANLSNAVGAAVADGQGAAAITDNEAAPTIAVGDTTVSEGGTAVFTVTLTGLTAVPISVVYATADGTAVATAGGPGTPDYTPTGGVLTFFPSAVGTQTRTVAVLLTNDATQEPIETFAVDLSGPTNGATLADGRGLATVIDDDGSVALSVDSPSVTEGDTGTAVLTFTVTLGAATGVPVSVAYATADGTATAAGGDYLPAAGTLTFQPGETTKTVSVAVTGDAAAEGDETVLLNLSGPVNAGIATGTGTGTIRDDEAPPTVTLSVSPGPVAEAGGVATITATLSGPAGTDVTVELVPAAYFPENAPSVLDPNEYVLSAARIVIPAGSLTGSVTLTSVDDDRDEPTQSVTFFTGEVTGATAAAEGSLRTATVTVADDDLPVAVADAYTTAEDTPLAGGSLLANDNVAPAATTGGDGPTVALLVSAGGRSPQGTLAFNPDGSFAYTPPADFAGTDTFQYRVRNADGELSNTVTVTITVTPVNDPPRFAVGPNPTAPRGDDPQTVPGFLTNISAGGPDEAGQAVAFAVTTDSPGLFRVPPAVDAAGTLTYTPAAAAFGTATVTITATDSGGAETTVRTFTITVNKHLTESQPTSQNESAVFAVGAGNGGPGTVTVYNPDGSVAYTVTPFADGVGSRAVVANTTGDATPDVIAGTGPGRTGTVVVLDGNTKQPVRTFTPFERSFTGGVFVAAGDVTGDGLADVVVTADTSGGPRVVVYDGRTGDTLADFFGIEDPDFRGGARLATGDVNGDGVADLVVVAGIGGGPRVAVFDGTSLRPGTKPAKLVNDFFAFEPGLRDGTYVTLGDLNADGQDDLIFGGGPNGGPRVLAFDARALFPPPSTDPAYDAYVAYKTRLFPQPTGLPLVTLTSFFAGPDTLRSGVRLAAKDLDGDRRADLITSTPDGSGGRVVVYLGKNLGPTGGDPESDLSLYPGLADGVYVG